MELEDNPILSFPGLTGDQFDIFHIKESKTRAFNKIGDRMLKLGDNFVKHKDGYDLVHTSLSFERDRDMIIYQRRVETLLDIMGNIGGLQGILVSIFSAIALIFTYKKFDNYMVDELFKAGTKDMKTANDLHIYMKSDPHLGKKHHEIMNE